MLYYAYLIKGVGMSGSPERTPRCKESDIYDDYYSSHKVLDLIGEELNAFLCVPFGGVVPDDFAALPQSPTIEHDGRSTRPNEQEAGS